MPDLSTDAKRKIDQLKKAYIDSFPEKTKQLQILWQCMQSEGYSKNNLTELAAFCHKLAGSSGSYEFQEISRAAHSVEMSCHCDFSSMEQDKAELNELKQRYLDLVKQMAIYQKPS